MSAHQRDHSGSVERCHVCGQEGTGLTFSCPGAPILQTAAHATPAPMTAETVTAHLRKQCNRYTNGYCSTSACMRRGGWSHGMAVDYAMATCEDHDAIAHIDALTARIAELVQLQTETERALAAGLCGEGERDDEIERLKAELAALRAALA